MGVGLKWACNAGEMQVCDQVQFPFLVCLTPGVQGVFPGPLFRRLTHGHEGLYCPIVLTNTKE